MHMSPSICVDLCISGSLNCQTRLNVAGRQQQDSRNPKEVWVLCNGVHPIHDPSYLIKTMESNVAYFGVEAADGELISLSSAEMDKSAMSVEMTDFAAIPAWRGHSLAAGYPVAPETTTGTSPRRPTCVTNANTASCALERLVQSDSICQHNLVQSYSAGQSFHILLAF